MPSLSGLGTPERKTGSVTEPESELAGLSRRFEQFQQFAAEKTKFEAVRAHDWKLHLSNR
jgi:hypothetical protein